jgi:glucosamine kinase
MPRIKRLHELRLYLGVDGGQSSTTALIADGLGRVVGVGYSGPCNHVAASEARRKFREVIGDCIKQASRGVRGGDEGLPRFAAACLGFSGGAADKLELTRELISSEHLKVTNDAEIALTGALEGQPGIIVIAGTGSIALGKNAEGRIARAGGWGYIFGDEGGAFDLVRQSLRAALRAEEGWGPETSLRPTLLREMQEKTANDLLHRFYRINTRQEIARLAPLVSNAAEAGDIVAREILLHAAQRLFVYAKGVHANLFPKEWNVPVAHIGGVFGSTLLLAEFQKQISECLRCTSIAPRLSPAAGALIDALRMDNNDSQLSQIPKTKT